jgi:hypothetical protein
MGRAYDMHARGEKCVKNVGWKPKERRQTGRYRHTQEDKIMMGNCELDLCGSG